MKKRKTSGVTLAAIIGGLILAAILVLGTLWMGRSASQDTEAAVRSVSLLYLDELAGRREQVLESNLRQLIRDTQVALELMEPEDLSGKAPLEQYQFRIKSLYNLERFAFVDTDGLIYTSTGTQDNIADYHFDYLHLSEPVITILNLDMPEKKVIVAVPVDIAFLDRRFSACFMQIDMEVMLSGASMNTNTGNTTFANLYTSGGIALTNSVLGTLSDSGNLLETMRTVAYESGYSYDRFAEDFTGGRRGVVSFTYHDIRETLAYIPVSGTDWQLTYLIRESVIGERISSISQDIVQKSILQFSLTVLVMMAMFAFIMLQTRRTAQLQLEKETADAESRVRQAELERRLSLQENLAEALAAAEDASRAKSAFLSNMSHEIRTPMNAIIGLNNIAMNDPEVSDKAREYLSKIGTSADHLLDLINDILDMSRIESGRMSLQNEEFSFPKMLEMVNNVISGQCAEKGLRYDCRVVGHLDECYIGDSKKLRQVLINILGNAVKFTPPGGAVTFSLERVAQYAGKSTLRFIISDTGIGMSPDFLPRLFDPFAQEDATTTTRYGSSGLGLAITKRIVEMMNGTIEVESEKGKGSTFTVTVTLSDADTEGGEPDAEIETADMTVLVVDDDPIAAEHARLVLEKAGIASEIALSGSEAVEMVRLRHMRRESYNLILLDWQMPEMDGVETARQIRAIVGRESAIIILTAYNWDDILEEATDAGVDRFLPKPLFAQSVLEEFRSARKTLAQETSKPKAELQGRRILLAEDVPINAEIMTMVLAARGMEADLAVNGKEALEAFERHEPGYYDAILMDMRMPEMDGLEATRRIRALDRPDARSIPIIALTANAFNEDVQRSLQAGLNAHLSKPVQPDLLYETLEGLL
ncbi:MAG: response regulator [Clostridia bacterium]|nr:response regulator [Clostridia bacterium]